MKSPSSDHPAKARASDVSGELALKALRVSESRYRRLFETAQDGILLLNADTAQIEDVNPYLIAMLGYSHEEFLGKKLWEVGPFADIAQSKEMFAELQTQGYVRYNDLPLKKKAGTKVPVEFVSNTYDCEGIKVIQCNIRNITERHADRAKIQRHTQLYATLSQCNKAIVHCANEGELFLQICRVAVQFGGMKMAWVGMIDPETRTVRPAASFGDDGGYLGDITISVDADSPFGRGPTATAIREDQPFWCQDFLSDPVTAPWHERAALAGLAASASLPLHNKGIVIGAFTLYSGEANAFDELARDLLVEMARDISFAVDNFDRESRRTQVAAEIEFKNTMLQTQQETSLDGILVVGENGQIISYNQRFTDLWRLSPQVVSTGRDAPVLEAVVAQVENSEVFVARIKYLYEHRDEMSREEVQIKDGRIVDRYSAPMIGADGKYYGRVWYFRDITERKKSEARIRYLNRVYAMLSGINTLIVRVRDRDELFREACRIAVETGGFRMAWLGVLDLRVMKIVPVASAGLNEEFLTGLAERYSASELGSPGIPLTTRALTEKTIVVANNLESNPTVVYRKELVEAGIGSMAILPLVVSDEAVGVLTLYSGESEFFREEELTLLMELAGDIAFAIEHIDRQDRLDFMAYYDELTGLANRRLFLDRVTQYIRSAASGGHKLAVFLIDLARFKNINDSLGRPAGDALLKQVAEWLTRNAGGDANLLARVGSDHFAAVLPEVRQEGDVARLIEKSMEGLLDSPFRLNDAVFRIAAKIGVALFPDDGADAETLFRNSEVALKKAKASGERYLFYTEEMTATVAGKLTLENQLRQALDNGEFVLHYQPKVKLASGKLTSAEALIRWNDPRTGLVPPGRFIPILEETGLIYEVGRWALRQAIADYLRWRAAGLAAVRIAVNVSPLQLRNRGFVDEIRQAIAIDEHAAAGLELEITESLIMEDIKHNIASLQAVRAMGISIAIDDFGTGFSSLSYLARLPVDTLKIDRSFVIDMTGGAEGLALVSTIINLAHSLKLKVVAEGVETEEQSHLLRLLDCDEMQGYLFSKPVPGDVFEARFLAPFVPG
ncbi:MAG: response regulator receiver [Rhodocyclaceae bacterium]|nr:MAG: response regulator receiver [Rhodocyclaceae bacterium]TND03599.1 MAG: response regulator receiver modulated PAS/PAC sensor-containing diguanylate cyclase/phosphodiesterase [Rhodocyclaceae bacterium]